MNPVILVLISTLFGGFGSLLLKKGAKDMELNLDLLKNYKLILGLITSATATIIFIFALQGGDLSYLYPFVSLTYIWILLFSNIFLHEKITKHKIYGVMLIVLGVSLIGL